MSSSKGDDAGMIFESSDQLASNSGGAGGLILSSSTKSASSRDNRSSRSLLNLDKLAREKREQEGRRGGDRSKERVRPRGQAYNTQKEHTQQIK